MKSMRILLPALIGLGWAAVALGEAEPGQWYLTPAVSGVWVDDSRPVDDHVGFGLGFGKVVNDKVNLEIMFQGSDNNGASGQADQDIRDFEFNVLRVWYRESRISPYLLLGLGWMSVDSSDPAWNQNDVAASIGFGLLSDLTHDGGIALRTELRLRNQSRDPSSVNDLIGTIGVQVPLGSPKAAPPPPPRDTDGDGVIDAQDLCPGTPRGRKVDSQGCEYDSDGDGVVDGDDECPNTPKGVAVNELGCPLDSDGDGVPDYLDNCPNTPKGDRVDIHGCSINQEITLRGVNFRLNSAELTGDSTATLNDAVATLKKHPDLTIEVAGYTDSSGDDGYNLDLSRQRAESVMNYLVSHGIAANRLTAKGYGETNPVASNATTAGRAENRRVTLRILNQ